MLDELPNTCALDNIDTYVSDGRGPGIPVMWIAQNKGQLVDRYGPAKVNAVIDATEAVLYGGGFDTPGLYETLSTRIGDTPIPRIATSRDAAGNVTSSTSLEHRPVMTAADLYTLGTHTDRHGIHAYGEAMLMSRSGNTIVHLTPWWSSRRRFPNWCSA